MRWTVTALACLLAAPAATAGFSIASPVGDVGEVPVGTPVTFHALHVDDDGLPTVHTDVPVRVLLDDDMIYETPGSAAHEYDGVHTFTVTFPRAGAYRVQALDGEAVAHEVTGTVTEPEVEEPVQDIGVEATRGIVEATYAVDVGAAGTHTETAARWTDGTRTLMRTSLHDHAEGHSLSFAPAGPGALETVHSVLQAGDGPVFHPFVHKEDVEPGSRSTAVAAPTAPSPQPRNAVTVAEGDGMVLVATYDPYTVVGPDTLMRIAIVALDPGTRAPLPHTQFDAELVGPLGPVFRSSSLHEHDGVWEFASRQGDVGTYTLHVTARNGDASADVRAKYTVVPPLEPRSVGVQTVRVEAPEMVAGEPTDIKIHIADAAGLPFDHGEVEVTVADTAGVPWLVTKVHSHRDGVYPLRSHGDGVYPLRFALPHGEWKLHLDPFPLEARPVSFEGDLEVGLAVAEVPGTEVVQGAQADSRSTPGPTWVGLLVVAVAATALSRRRPKP